jgi:hypothetical protein
MLEVNSTLCHLDSVGGHVQRSGLSAPFRLSGLFPFRILLKNGV